MEIERKYALRNLPGELSQYRYKKIEQGYLCHKPTLRIRKSNEDYILTYKSKLGAESANENRALINHEVELPLTEEAFMVLKAKTDGNIVCKTRYLIPLEDGLTAELDVFEGNLSGLLVVEVEFPDEKTADEFVPPAWFGKELSSDKRFSNYHLSKLSGLEELDLQ
jgi:CYTH domain-containing protein